MFQKFRSSESGFTLVELLIVIIILGVLAGVAVFAVGSFTNKGVEEACKTDSDTVEVALEAYRQEELEFQYPPAGAFDHLTQDGDISPAGGNGTDDASEVLKRAPQTPPEYNISWDAATGDVIIENPAGGTFADCDAVIP